MTDALFLVDGDAMMPTELSVGPWSPDALHGGPVAALVARAVEATEADPHMHVSRLTVELLRPTPRAPLEVSATMARPGRKVQVVDVTVSAAGTQVAWGRAVRIRTLPGDPADYGLPDTPASRAPAGTVDPPPGPAGGFVTTSLNNGSVGFANGGTELRVVSGNVTSAGPATVWVRLAVPLVADEAPSSLQRIMAAADFGNGFSWVLDFERFIFINPDLTVYVTRPARGEWVCVQASTALGLPGTGMAQSQLWDQDGPVGRSLQSLFIDRRP